MKDNGVAKNDKIKQLKELRYMSMNNFKSSISQQWGSFQSIESIDIHITKPYSFPPDDTSGLSVIKNSDTNEYIKNPPTTVIKAIII